MPKSKILLFQASQRRIMAVLLMLVLVMSTIVCSALWLVVKQAEILATPSLHGGLWHSYQISAQLDQLLQTAEQLKAGSVDSDDLILRVQVLRSVARRIEERHLLRFIPPSRPHAQLALRQVDHLSKRWDAQANWGDAESARQIADEVLAVLPTLNAQMPEVLVAADISSSNELDADRQRLYSHFKFLGWALLGLLIGGALLVIRLIVSYREVRQLSLRLGNLNLSLESRVEQRTQELSEGRALLNYILEASPSDVALLNANDSQVHFVNERLLKRNGINDQQDFSLQKLFADSDEAQRFHEALQARQQINEWEALLAGKEPYWGVVSGRVLVQNGRTFYLIWSYDISVRKQMEQKLLSLANTDSLTGLNNRHAFIHQAEDLLKHNHRFEHQCAVLMIDIDHFKQINDAHGHQVGDIALCAAANLFQQDLRSVDVLGRLGGEEFAILLPETDAKQAQQVAERIRERIECMHVQLPTDGQLHMTISIGLAMGQANESLNTLLGRADAALYQAKASGRNKVQRADQAAASQTQ